MSEALAPGSASDPQSLIDAQILRDRCYKSWTHSGHPPGSARPDVEVLEAIDSTNRVLMEAPFGDVPAPPRLVVALRQTAGRGRRGRGWVSPPASSLTFSVAFERAGSEVIPGAWSLLVGLALAEELAPIVPDLALKWPNDLQRAGHKCGGILCESRRQAAASGRHGIERVVSGIGLNLLPDPGRAAIEQPVAALFDADLPRSREELLAGILAALGRRWARHETLGLAGLPEQWAGFDALAGQNVAILDQGRVLYEGEALGVDAAGALRLRVGDEVRSLSFGEVSVRARAASGRAVSS